MAKTKKKGVTRLTVQEIFDNCFKETKKKLRRMHILIVKIDSKLDKMEKQERDFWSQYPWISH